LQPSSAVAFVIAGAPPTIESRVKHLDSAPPEQITTEDSNPKKSGTLVEDQIVEYGTSGHKSKLESRKLHD
jgi:hypothetical protein|tara:strand:- start:206 stop:418 length:213 start_codon:yes stop_codon:yes gene_type:complete